MTNQPPPGGSYPPPPGSSSGGYRPSSAPPPPPPGGYPPPPPPVGAVAPPPPGPAIRELPTESYTPWITRVLAFLIDYALVLVIVAVTAVISIVVPDDSIVSTLVNLLGNAVLAAYFVWNYGYKQGTTGSSLGKSIMKFKVVSEVTGDPLGFAMSLVRQVAHFVDAIICYVGFLFPLWDSKRQTLADKIMTTVCLPL